MGLLLTEAMDRGLTERGLTRTRAEVIWRLAPLVAALERLPANPARILDIGTGTGAAALEPADRLHFA